MSAIYLYFALDRGRTERSVPNPFVKRDGGPTCVFIWTWRRREGGFHRSPHTGPDDGQDLKHVSFRSFVVVCKNENTSLGYFPTG